MILHPRFAFIEMPRTGSTHTVRLLQRLFDVERIGMHEPAPLEVRESGRAFLGTIRNPWDWYVSQWSVGCGGGGMLHAVTTGRARRRARSALRDEAFDPAPWRSVYADASARDVGLFRDWLDLMLSPQAMRLAFPTTFGASDLNVYAGWYTYRYVELFCDAREILHRRGALPDETTLRSVVREKRYVAHFARTEHLGPELEAALDDIGVELSVEQRREILTAAPTNRSHRSLPLEAYYDDIRWQRVARRDALILEHYPVPSEGR